MQRVSKILFPVAEDLTLAPATLAGSATRVADIAAAAEGAFVVVDPATGLNATSAAKTVEVYVKCGDGIVSSGPIKKGYVKTGFAQSDFAASTPRILTTSAVPTPVLNREYVIYVSNQEADNYLLPRQRFSVVADAAITTASLLGDAFATAMTDTLTVTTPGSVAGTNAELGISVANNAGVLTVTGIDSDNATPMLSSNVKFAYEVLFELAMGDNMEAVTITRTQEPDPGCGEGSEVRKMEEIHKGYLGHLNNVKFSSVAYGSGYTYKSALATDYDMIVVEFDSPHYSIQEGNVPFQETLTFVAPTGAGNACNSAAAANSLTEALVTTLSMDTDW